MSSQANDRFSVQIGGSLAGLFDQDGDRQREGDRSHFGISNRLSELAVWLRRVFAAGCGGVR
jgi:hypothetical protein